MKQVMSEFIADHIATLRGVGGLVVSVALERVSAILTVVVLALTAVNLVYEIRKKLRERKDD